MRWGYLKRDCILGAAGLMIGLALAGMAGGKDEPATRRAEGNRKYVPATAQEIRLTNEEDKLFAAAVEKKLNLKLTEFETQHFRIHTNWEPTGHEFLKKNLEEGYAAVTRQFDIPSSENIFRGKLPVYMLAKQKEFDAFCKEFTSIGKANKEKKDKGVVMGFHAKREVPLTDGSTLPFSYMCMWQPVRKSKVDYPLANPEVQWAYTLAHEMTHAFVARYRGDHDLPTWLKEGIAEVVASSAVPDPLAIVAAKEFLKKDKAVLSILTQDGRKTGDEYPVMRSLVETLVAGDKKAFLKLFGDMKDGMTAEEALTKHYHTDHQGLIAAWKKYLSQK